MPSITLYPNVKKLFQESTVTPGAGFIWSSKYISMLLGFTKTDYHDQLYGKELTEIGNISGRLTGVYISSQSTTARLWIQSGFSLLANLPLKNGSFVQSSPQDDVNPVSVLNDDINYTITTFGTGDASADIYGPDSPYPPYITVSYQPAQVSIKSQTPGNGGYFPKHESKRLSWGYDYSQKVYGAPEQQSYTIEIINGSSGTAKTIAANTSQKYADIPAGTITADNMKWRVKSITVDSVATPWSDWMTLQTIDSIPVVTPLSPSNTYLDKTGNISFSWNYNISTGTSQTRADLQYSTDGAIWNDLARVTGAATSANIDSSLLPGGTIYWRVRGYNSDGVAGGWSGAVSFVLRGAPNPPIIDTITSDPRPIIKWQAAGQISFQLQIGDFLDTGETAGTSKSYRVSDYLSKGEYPLRLRIKNDLGQWSVWTSGTISIRFTTPSTPTVSYTAAGKYVQLTVSNASKFAKLYLLRDGKPVGKFLSGTYWDYTAGSINYYTIRGVDSADRWADRELTVKNKMPEGVLLAGTGSLDHVVWLKYTLNAPRELTSSIQFTGEYIQLAGRRWPVRISSGNDTAQYTILAAEFEQNLRDMLEPLVKTHQTILYRNSAENRVYGIINDIEYTDQWMGSLLIHSVGITISQVDFRETIEYDPPTALMAYSLSKNSEVEILIGEKQDAESQ